MKKEQLKMKTLNESYKLLALLCVCSREKTDGWWILVRNIVFTIFAIFSLIMASVTSTIFAIRFIETDLENSLPAIAQSALAIGEIYTFLSAFVLRKKVQETFAAFQNVYDTCE